MLAVDMNSSTGGGPAGIGAGINGATGGVGLTSQTSNLVASSPSKAGAAGVAGVAPEPTTTATAGKFMTKKERKAKKEEAHRAKIQQE